MKKLSLLLVLILSLVCISQTFADTKITKESQSADVYTFAQVPEVTTSITEIPELSKVAAISSMDDIEPTEEILLADAQTLIRDKLVEKYQVRLDKIMEQLAKKLTGVPAEIQRKALVEVQ